MPETETKSENDDTLKGFIDRLQDWPEDDPPSPGELRALRREFRLTRDQRDKLESLAENHIRRGRAALEGGSYDQAAAGLARASQLRPMDSGLRVELAGIYLGRSLARGYGKNDRKKAVRLARKALELNPGDVEARAFLRDYRRMNADFLNVATRRYLAPVAAVVLVTAGMLWWQKERVFSLFHAPLPVVEGHSMAVVEPGLPGSQPVEVKVEGLDSGGISTEILSADIGRRNDGSYIHILGRMKTTQRTLGAVDLVVRGRNAGGEAIFALPWSVRRESDPDLRPGDSQPLATFRWLAESEAEVRHLELAAVRVQSRPEEKSTVRIDVPEIVWDAPRPEGAAITAEIRNRKTVEAYDRQALIMELAVENTGTAEISRLILDISLGPDWPALTHPAVDTENPPMERSERRVWGLSMGFPLNADLSERPVTLRVAETGER